jgi:nucleoside-diphosphate-sugar epimerase
LSRSAHVLVTGGAGFLGSYVVRDLLRAGEEVIVLDSIVTLNALDSVLEPHHRERLSIEQGDVTDGWRLLRLCERHGVDRIVHLASPLTAAIRESPSTGLAAMCGGTANVLEAARARGVRRVVWASSISVFGQPPPGRVGNDAPRRPESLYGSGKVLCEDLAGSYRSDAGVDSIGLRLTVLYGAWRLRGWGPSFGQDSDPIRAALDGEPVVVNDPELLLDWLYVEDAAALVCRSLDVPTPADHVFNTSGEAATRREFAERIAEVVSSSIEVVEPDEGSPDRSGEPASFDDSALRSQIGYGSHHSLQGGIEATVAAYRRTGVQGERHG